ncbi:MAG: tyrosine--tRNA ligase [Chitinophagales bacterium]|nr:tyrosine--tRNA ligase [Bacteroidota bacterium]MBK7569607.1 tyrosine--tRNA ligase [Bacteroidota bacterium]MBP8916667.1 tyrosine--tRNA ligase [Chitinophagales bacterium]MBP9220480.1 tyrosine--tRNA ligase [Chitinophagales bacterium]
MKNFVEELRWRGMLSDLMPGTEEFLNKGMAKGYIGFDPTADSMGVGNMVQIMTLLHFQQCGHKPIALIGGATGMVGDPSGKSAERNLLDEETLNHNIACQKKQLEKFLNFNDAENSAELVNNYDWMKDISFLDFLREVGKYLTVSYMMAKDSVQTRLEKGISFTEFTYQLVQGYDFYYLWKNKNVQLQMGGSDQWGNITTGNELIRRKGNGEAFAICTPLIKKADGTKFGKTESGNIWLDANKTSPYKFYQFWMNASDADAENYIKIFTLHAREFIEDIISRHQLEPHTRLLQKELAKDITIRVHGEENYNNAVSASELLFRKSTKDDFEKLSEGLLLDALEGAPQSIVAADLFENGVSFSELITTHTSILASKGEYKRAIQENALSINKEKISDSEYQITKNDLIKGKFLLLQKGKKNYYLIIAQ